MFTYRLILRYVLLTLLLGSGPMAAAASTWDDLIREAQRAQREQAWDLANRTFEQALGMADAAADRAEDPTRIIRTLELWILARTAEGQRSSTAELQERVIELRLGFPGSKPIENVLALYRLGALRNQIGPYRSAEEAFRKALEVRGELAGEGFPSEATLLRSLASVLQKLRPEDEERGRLLERLVAVDDEVSHRQLLGRYLAETARHDEAIFQFRRAIEAERLAAEPNGDRIVSLGRSLASELADAGRVDEAEEALVAAMEYQKQIKGIDHPHLAALHKQLGAFYVDEGRFAEAEPELERALALDEAAWGPRPHLCGCNVSSLLAQVYEALGREAELAALLASHPELAELAELTGSAATLESTDRVDLPEDGAIEEALQEARRLGEFDRALELGHDSLELRRGRYGEQSEETLDAVWRIADLYRRRGDHARAVEFLRELVSRLEATESSASERMASALLHLARSLRAAGRNDEAERYLLRELELREVLGQPIRVATSLQELGRLYRSIGELGEARSRLNEAIDVWLDLAGEAAPEIETLRVTLAELDSEK